MIRDFVIALKTADILERIPGVGDGRRKPRYDERAEARVIAANLIGEYEAAPAGRVLTEAEASIVRCALREHASREWKIHASVGSDRTERTASKATDLATEFEGMRITLLPADESPSVVATQEPHESELHGMPAAVCLTFTVAEASATGTALIQAIEDAGEGADTTNERSALRKLRATRGESDGG